MTVNYFLFILLNLTFFILDIEIIMREALRTDSCKHVWRFKIDEKISKVLFSEYYKLLKKRKKPKRKKGKKGKKGKGKKKK